MRQIVRMSLLIPRPVSGDATAPPARERRPLHPRRHAASNRGPLHYECSRKLRWTSVGLSCSRFLTFRRSECSAVLGGSGCPSVARSGSLWALALVPASALAHLRRVNVIVRLEVAVNPPRTRLRPCLGQHEALTRFELVEREASADRVAEGGCTRSLSSLPCLRSRGLHRHPDPWRSCWRWWRTRSPLVATGWAHTSAASATALRC